MGPPPMGMRPPPFGAYPPGPPPPGPPPGPPMMPHHGGGAMHPPAAAAPYYPGPPPHQHQQQQPYPHHQQQQQQLQQQQQQGGAGGDPNDGDANPDPDDDPELAELEAQAAAIEAEAAAQEEAERRARAAAAWTAHRAPDGRAFYHNAATGESSWTRPADFRGDDAGGVAGVPVPVAQAAVGATGWTEVKCQDGRRYWARGRETTWAEPPDVTEHKRRAEAEAAAAARRMREAAEGQRLAQQREAQALGAAVGGAAAPRAPLSAEELRRHHLAAARGAAAGGAGDGPPPADERAARLEGFRALLADAGVNGFSFWAKVAPKLEKDPRWKLLPAKERREAFEEFCKDAGAGQKAAKEAATRAAERGFRALLEEAVALEKRVHAEVLAGAAAERAEGGGGGGGNAEGASLSPPPSPSAVEEEDLEGLTFAALEEHWGSDARWRAATEQQRADLFEERFGAVVARAEERREVRSLDGVGATV